MNKFLKPFIACAVSMMLMICTPMVQASGDVMLVVGSVLVPDMAMAVDKTTVGKTTEEITSLPDIAMSEQPWTYTSLSIGGSTSNEYRSYSGGKKCEPVVAQHSFDNAFVAAYLDRLAAIPITDPTDV